MTCTACRSPHPTLVHLLHPDGRKLPFCSFICLGSYARELSLEEVAA